MGSDQQVNKKRTRAKKHTREEDYVEKLEKEIRELKAINRSLTRQLKKRSRGINKDAYEEALTEVENGTKEKGRKREPDCPACGKGFIKEFDIAGRVFGRCNVCEHKTGRIR